MGVKKIMIVAVLCLILVLAGPLLLSFALGTDVAVVEAAYTDTPGIGIFSPGAPSVGSPGVGFN